MGTEIERTTDLRKVLEERILDNKVELSLREVLRIAKKEFHNPIVDLVKRKRLSTETEPERPVEVRTTHIDDMALEDEWAESHYFYKKGKWPINTKHGWKIRAATRATEELHGACPNVQVKIGDVEIESGHTRGTVHHGSANGDQGAGQRFGLREGQNRESLGGENREDF